MSKFVYVPDGDKEIKKDKKKIKYYSPDKFKKLEGDPKVTGWVDLSVLHEEDNEHAKNFVGVTSINGKTYSVYSDFKNKTAKGYLKLEDGSFLLMEKSLFLALLFDIFLGVALVIFCITIIKCLFPDKNEIKTPPVQDTTEEATTLPIDTDSFDYNEEQHSQYHEEEETGEQQMINVPGYLNLYVDKDHPYIILNNPSENMVYFQYTIMDADGNVIFENPNLLEPGKAIQADLYTPLTEGKHMLTFLISTYDLENQAPCNGASQEVDITVKGKSN